MFANPVKELFTNLATCASDANVMWFSLKMDLKLATLNDDYKICLPCFLEHHGGLSQPIAHRGCPKLPHLLCTSDGNTRPEPGNNGTCLPCTPPDMNSKGSWTSRGWQTRWWLCRSRGRRWSRGLRLKWPGRVRRVPGTKMQIHWQYIGFLQSKTYFTY